MEQISYIDEHAITIDATPAESWSALLTVMCRNPNDPAAVPLGFVLDEATPPQRFALKGRHPFAVYRWVFELAPEADTEGPQRTRVRSQTWANFPGLHGKVYRALVIGTGAHRVVVRLMLKRIAAAAHPRGAGSSVTIPGLNWGATPTERTAALQCDALIPYARTRADRAIRIDASPSIVFAWLCQLRVAPYSYDILDNVGHLSPRQRNPDLTRLEVGQQFMTIFTLRSFVNDEQITLRSKGVAVTYAVRPDGAGARLHVRVVGVGPRVLGRVLALGDMVMMRKQLLTLRELAEREARNSFAR